MICLMEILKIYLEFTDKILRVKSFNIAKNLKYDGYQRGIASMIYKLFDKNHCGSNSSGNAVKSEIMSNQLLDEELHKPIIRKFEIRNAYSAFNKIFGVLILHICN